MNFREFIETLYEYDEEMGEHHLIMVLLDLSMKGYDLEEVLSMDAEEVAFLFNIPFMKSNRKGTTTWGAHLATLNS